MNETKAAVPGQKLGMEWNGTAAKPSQRKPIRIEDDDDDDDAGLGVLMLILTLLILKRRARSDSDSDSDDRSKRLRRSPSQQSLSARSSGYVFFPPEIEKQRGSEGSVVTDIMTTWRERETHTHTHKTATELSSA